VALGAKAAAANDRFVNALQTHDRRALRSAGGRLALLVLHSPLRFLLEPGLAELAYIGPVSGRVIRLPVMYAQADNQVVVLAAGGHRKTWWRNFRRPRWLEVTIAGRLWDGSAVVTSPGTEEFHRALAVYRGRFPRMRYLPGDQLVAITLLTPAGQEA
jgi:hypothetical protein